MQKLLKSNQTTKVTNVKKNIAIVLGGKKITIKELGEIVHENARVTIHPNAYKRVKKAYEYLQTQIKNKVIYGVNTGFGPMANHVIGKGQVVELQRNLILSHAAGIGEPIREEFVLAAMVVRLNSLCQGYSGVSTQLLEHLLVLINKRIIPIVPEHGAVGTSGDLVQLAHIAQVILGEGEVFYQHKRHFTKNIFAKLGIKPYSLEPKEGLSLINGTAVMTGIAALNCIESRQILGLATQNGALSLEIVNAFRDGISARLQALRPHTGQVSIAKLIRDILASSKAMRDREELEQTVTVGESIQELDQAVQEIYSIRCIPQILGPVFDTLTYAEKIVEAEINSVTDNPIVDVKAKKFLHGGNFHGEYIAATTDQLKMVLVKLTMLSERRVNFFLHSNKNKIFPPFLNLKKPGLTLGLQGIQFVATSTTAQNQTYAYPHSVHSISTNGENQDVVSMGTDAAIIASRVIDNAYVVLAIEAITLAQAVDFLKLRNSLSKRTGDLYDEIRKCVPKVIDDRSLSQEANRLVQNLRGKKFTLSF